MANKPTYEELEQRVKELENETFEWKQAEKVLKEDELKLRVSEQKLNSILHHSPDIIYRLNPAGEITYINDIVKEYGYSREDLIGKNILEFVHPDDREKAVHRINERRTDDRSTKSLEIRLLRKDLDCVPFEDKSRGFGDFSIDAEGIYSSEKQEMKSFVGTQGIARDITERKQAEETLQEGEERQRSLIEAVSRAGILLFVVDNEYKVRYMNEPMIAGFGDATGRICYLEVGGLDSPCEYCQVSKVIGDGERVHYQPTVADGRTFDIMAVPYTDIDGTRCKLEIIQDVTSQMQAEEALRESEEKFRTFTEMAPVGVFVTGADGLTTYWNKRLCEITGMQVVDGLGTGWADGVHPDDRERVFKEWYESAEKRASFSCEYRFVDRDGAVTHTIGQASPLIDASSRVTGYVGTITDVTDLKQAEVALWESKDFFTQMFVQSKTSTQLFDPDGNCIRVNPEFCNLFGVTEKDITSGYNIFNDQAAIDSGVIPLVRQIFDDKKANKWQINFDIETASVSTNTHSTRKEKIWIDVLGYPVLDRNGSLQYVVLQHYDITEQKQAKEALKRAHDNLEMQVKERTAELIKTNEALHASEVRFRTIYENAPALISAFEKNGRCILWNNPHALRAQQKMKH